MGSSPALFSAGDLGAALVEAWGSWCPTLSPHAEQMAFVSDRNGVPQVFVQDLRMDGHPDDPTMISLSDDPVVSVNWSADGAWLACAVATGGGVRTQVWVVRPDGSEAHRIAGSVDQHARLGPWTRSGHRVTVIIPDYAGDGQTHCFLADPATGELHPMATGDLLDVLDMSVDEHLVILKDGQRGKQFCVVVDRLADQDHPLLPYPDTGSTEVAIIRPAPPGDVSSLIAYVCTDAGLPRNQLVAVPVGAQGRRGHSGVLAARDDAELEDLDADDAGRQLLLVWNVGGRSELELFDTVAGIGRTLPGLPGSVVSGALLSRDGRRVILAVEGPERPRELWCLSTRTLTWTRVAGVSTLPQQPLVSPELITYRAHDGLELTGWLYRVPGQLEPGPAMLSLHGGPEAQERPVFSPQHQAMVAAGIAVLAPNIRGSSGLGRAFVHADDVHGRRDAFEDVITSTEVLIRLGVAERDRIAITGRSYGGYLTLTGLAFYPGVFAAGVDICGMSDLHTFYRDTEPWIAAAAVSKYGDPVTDAALLAAISPLHRAENIDVPLLVVHGELDTNVPIGEAQQIVAALRDLDRPVEYLQLDGEGHEYRRTDSRILLITTMLEFLGKALAG
ncbi:MAG TPA: prolyl oligopeptidase family serine peptidase [Microlunatus sp.]|nr:prolyl oligopeptidase family serine peptidase [Microlunatus sp.]